MRAEYMNDQEEKEMIKIEQGTSFDGEWRCIIASLTTHDGVANDGDGGEHLLVGI